MSNPFELDDDELRWKIWDCSFYGKIPSISGDSVASLVLPMDVWILDLCIDEVLWESIPLTIQPSGFYSFKTDGKGVYLPKGTLVSTHIRSVSEEEEGDHYMTENFESRYSIFLFNDGFYHDYAFK